VADERAHVSKSESAMSEEGHSPGRRSSSTLKDVVAGLATCAMGALILVLMETHPPDDMAGYARWAMRGFGALFFGVGLLVAAQGAPWARGLAILGVVIAFGGAVLGLNAIVFGSGTVQCTRMISLPVLPLVGQASDLECRVVASFLALPIDGLVALAVATLIAGATAPGPRRDAVKRWGGRCMLVGLLPILVVFGIVMHVKGDGAHFWKQLAEYWREGRASDGPAHVG
jgi:hypothetical protein